MIKHIVMWTLKEQDPAKKAEILATMKEMLEGLLGKVEGLINVEVGFNYNPEGHDISLYSTLTSKEALNYYQGHPEHLKVKAYVRSVIATRAVSDYEI